MHYLLEESTSTVMNKPTTITIPTATSRSEIFTYCSHTWQKSEQKQLHVSLCYILKFKTYQMQNTILFIGIH